MKYFEKNLSFSEGFQAKGEVKELVDKMESLATEREDYLKRLEKTRLNMNLYGQGIMANPGVNRAWKIPFLEDQILQLERIVRNCLINDELKNQFVVEYAKGKINSGLSSAAVVMLGSDAIKKFDEMQTVINEMKAKISALEQRSPIQGSCNIGFESGNSFSKSNCHPVLTAVSPSGSISSRAERPTSSVLCEDSVDGYYFSPPPIQIPDHCHPSLSGPAIKKPEEPHSGLHQSLGECRSPANQLKEAVRESAELEIQRRDSLVNDFKLAVKTRALSGSSENDDAERALVLDDPFQIPPRMVKPKINVPVPANPAEPLKIEPPATSAQPIASDEDPEEQEVEPLIASMFAESLDTDKILSEVVEMLEPLADSLNWKPFIKVLVVKSIQNSCLAEKGAQIYERLATKAVIYERIRDEVLSRCQKLFMARVQNVAEWSNERLTFTTGLIWLMARLYTAPSAGKRMSILAVATLELLKTSVKLQAENVKGCLRTVFKVLHHMKIELTKDTFKSVGDELKNLKAEVTAKEASLSPSMAEEKKLVASIIQLLAAIP